MTLHRATHSQYSRGEHPMQRSYLTSKRQSPNSALACAGAEKVPASESRTKNSFGDNNAHSELLVVTTREAHVFQRNREAWICTLLAGRTRGSGTLRKTCSKGVW